MPKHILLPWKKEEAQSPVKQAEDPVHTLQQDMNQMFDNFFSRSFGMRPFGFDQTLRDFEPRVDVVDGEDAIKVSAELPGLDENNIELSLDHQMLRISGEKTAESEDKGKNYYKMERFYGSFTRSIPLPGEVDAEKVEASFKKGVLTVVLPKIQETGRSKHIKITR